MKLAREAAEQRGRLRWTGGWLLILCMVLDHCPSLYNRAVIVIVPAPQLVRTTDDFKVVKCLEGGLV